MTFGRDKQLQTHRKIAINLGFVANPCGVMTYLLVNTELHSWAEAITEDDASRGLYLRDFLDIDGYAYLAFVLANEARTNSLNCQHAT